MQPIDVRPQATLSPARTFGLCMKGIRHRLFRSVLTTMVVILAVAFFMKLMADSVVARSVDAGVRDELHLARRSAVAVDLWFGRPGAAVLADRLAQPEAPLADYAAIAGWKPERLAALATTCRGQALFLSWLDGLDSGTRAMLVRRARNDEVLAWLAAPGRWDAFTAAIADIHSHRLPMPAGRLRELVDGAGAAAGELAALSADWAERIAALSAGIAGLTGAQDRDGWTAWLAGADDDGTARFAALLAAHGFGGLYARVDVDRLRDDLRLDGLREMVVKRLATEQGRERWLKTFRVQSPLEDKLRMLDDPRVAAVVGEGIDPADLARLAVAIRAERTLNTLSRALAGRVAPDGGLVSPRQGLLVAISFVVCMVGIANAMLMAITERFREIATMKCLGATDGFILTQFLMEAGIQGAFGGAIGTTLGLAIALVTGGWSYGWHLLSCFPALGLIGAAAVCVVAGLLLATLASIYPSWMASRMAPMEAMRVE